MERESKNFFGFKLEKGKANLLKTLQHYIVAWKRIHFSLHQTYFDFNTYNCPFSKQLQTQKLIINILSHAVVYLIMTKVSRYSECSERTGQNLSTKKEDSEKWGLIEPIQPAWLKRKVEFQTKLHKIQSNQKTGEEEGW